MWFSADIYASVQASSEDLDDFTEEKMRGEAYIRMLCKPVKCSDINRHVKVNKGAYADPDASLLLQTKFNMKTDGTSIIKQAGLFTVFPTHFECRFQSSPPISSVDFNLLHSFRV